MDEYEFRRALTKVIGALSRADVPFAVAGGAAVYAHGGPHSDHDIDLLVPWDEIDRAATVLVRTGMTREVPPEDWLLKVYDGEVLIDLIHRRGDTPVTAQTLERAEQTRIGSIAAPVITATELMVDKMVVLDEHRCDFAELLVTAKILREQVDWAAVRWSTRGSPFARAFSQLLVDLSITDACTGHDAARANVLPSSPVPREYAVARARRVLAEDPLVAELGIDIAMDSDTMRLVGAVSCEQRRTDIEAVVRQIVGPIEIVNDIEVVRLGRPAEQAAR